MRGAERDGGELSLTPIRREAFVFVFFVHNKSSVEELTVEQIQGIYSGKITEEIRAFQRPEGSGSQSALISVMDGTR